MKIFFQQNASSAFLDNTKFIPFSSSTRWFFDREALIKQMKNWNKQLPWIRPYYAMKSNPSLEILETIVHDDFKYMNVGLDAASINEVKLASQYLNHENIIYTHPHTIPHEKDEVKQCLETMVHLKVVDSLCEIKKMVDYGIQKNILIRLNSNTGGLASNVKFDSKFGATVEEAVEIFDYSVKHDYNVKGVSFHIGSGGEFSRNQAFKIAIDYAMPLIEIIQLHNKSNDVNNETNKIILDIGGGMLYNTDLEDALGWTKDLPFTMIAELGRYFSEPVYHLAVQVIAKTSRGIFIDNGVYHELNAYHRDHWEFPEFTHFSKDRETIEQINEEDYENIHVFGVTCDSYDNFGKCVLPKYIDTGDWIFFHNMGAYTSAAKVDFNGIFSASSFI